jgi:flagellar protein FliS
MFGPHHSQSHSSFYSRVQVDTGVLGADPHRLVAMLFEGAMGAIARAQGAIQRGDVAAKGKAIGQAVSIIEEGLRGALDMGRGGEVAAALDELYVCVIYRLTLANAKNDVAPLRECVELLTPVQDAWNSIRSQVAPA